MSWSDYHKDKVALVTGAGTGLGFAIVSELAKAGAKVAMVGRRKEKLDAAVATIKAEVPDAQLLVVAGDVTKTADFDRVIDETVNEFGTIDYLVNNAGIEGDQALLVDIDFDSVQRVIETNLVAAVYGVKKVAPIMGKQGKGAIVNISSTASVVGVPYVAAYTVAKHGLVGLAKVAAIELAPLGIRVNNVAPGGTRTEMIDGFVKTSARDQGKPVEEVEAALTGNVPMKRFGEPIEQANAVLFLLSDLASYITGVNLLVDGGVTDGMG
jgi:NAD(P)-dependent dehydrogenase (short-subunit alcohol dehydrogenase family)